MLGPHSLARPSSMDDHAFSSDSDADTVVAPLPVKQQEERQIPKYHVVLWDSDEHTYEYVEKMLRELFGHTQQHCLKLAETVDEEGRAVVLTTTLEHAELKRDQIHAYGKDDYMKNCQGSMKASIEEA